MDKMQTGAPCTARRRSMSSSASRAGIPSEAEFAGGFAPGVRGCAHQAAQNAAAAVVTRTASAGPRTTNRRRAPFVCPSSGGGAGAGASVGVGLAPLGVGLGAAVAGDGASVGVGLGATPVGVGLAPVGVGLGAAVALSSLGVGVGAVTLFAAMLNICELTKSATAQQEALGNRAIARTEHGSLPVLSRKAATCLA